MFFSDIKMFSLYYLTNSLINIIDIQTFKVSIETEITRKNILPYFATINTNCINPNLLVQQ